MFFDSQVTRIKKRLEESANKELFERMLSGLEQAKTRQTDSIRRRHNLTQIQLDAILEEGRANNWSTGVPPRSP